MSLLHQWYCSLGQCCESGDCRITNNITGTASKCLLVSKMRKISTKNLKWGSCFLSIRLSIIYQCLQFLKNRYNVILGTSVLLLKSSFTWLIQVLFYACGSFLRVSSARGRSGVGPPDKAPRAAPGSVCGPESHPGFYQQPRVQQATDPVLPRLVWHRQELRGPNDRRQPVS